MAKAAAANGRNKPKDWYDLAYVLLHNDDGPTAGADAVTEAFGSVAVDSDSQGTRAYVEQFLLDHPGNFPCNWKPTRFLRWTTSALGFSADQSIIHMNDPGGIRPNAPVD